MTTQTEYHRPEGLEEALALLGRASPITRPLAGGTRLGPDIAPPEALVDLAALPLADIARRDTTWRIGATATLEALAAADLPAGLRVAAERHAPRNIRQRATVGGVVAARSAGSLTAALLALDARILIEPGDLLVPVEVYLQGYEKPGHLIVSVELPLNRECALNEVSKSPVDAPVIVVAVGAERTASGPRHFIAAAAGAGQPLFLLAGASQLLEGAPDAGLPALAAVTPGLDWRDDARGSAEYRNAMIPVLLQRATAQLLAAEVNHAG